MKEDKQTEKEEQENLLQRNEDVVALQKVENDRTAELVIRLEKAKVTDLLGGETNAGQAPEPKKVLTDREYAEALEKGEVNPFRDDKVEGY